MKSFISRPVLILCLTCQVSVPAFPQQPAPQKQGQDPSSSAQQPARTNDDDVVRITTNLVQVDAVITGKDGKQVTDLGPEEVEILEDGKPQETTNFSYVALDSAVNQPAQASQPVDKKAPPAPPLRLRPEQVRRTMALVVDDLGLSFESAYFVRQALKKFLDQQMQANDLVAIIRTGGGIGALQQFTSDKRQLYAAVEKVKWNPRGRGGVGAFAPISNDSLAGSSNSSRDERTDDDAADIESVREDVFAVGTLGAVNYIVKGLEQLPGRKSILLISDGFRIFTRSDPFGNQRILTALRRLTDLANRASVVIYTMDARGLQTIGFTAADSTDGMSIEQIERSLSNRRSDFFESQNGLNYLAQQTGGLAIRNTNDLNAGIKRVIADQQGYYLIGYRPDESTFDSVSGRRKFHKLSLKIKRPGKFNVRMRRGFYGITDEETAPKGQTPIQQLVGALTSPFGSAGVHVRLTSLFINDAQSGSVMRSMLHVNGRDLTFTAETGGWHKAAFDVLAVTFGDNGVVVDQIGRIHNIRLDGKTYERVLKDGLTYNIFVPVKKAGAYQLRAALRDVGSERVGSAAQFIEVPDLKKKRLTLSGVVLWGVPLEAYRKGKIAFSPLGNPDNTIAESDPQVDPAVRQFKPGFVLFYGFSIYNAQIDRATGKPQLQTQIKLFRNGQQVFTGQEISYEPPSEADLKRLRSVGAIQLGTDMGPGDYVFQVIVTDLLAKDRWVSQWIDFEIVK